MVDEEVKDQESAENTEAAEAAENSEESKANDSGEESKVNESGGETPLPELARPLEKMTVKELKEIGLQIPSLVGVHGMRKAELLIGLREAYGIKEEARTGGGTVKGLKVKIRELKGLRAEALKAGEKPQAKILRRRISRLKKRTRKAAAVA